MVSKIAINGILAALIIIFCDQVTKLSVIHFFASQSSKILVINSLLNLVLVFNTGITFGSFTEISNGPLLFSAIAIIITGILLIWLVRVKEAYLAYALGLIIGGAVGNIIDRLRIGAVTDFIDVHWQQYHWYVFNVADASICIGIMLIVLDSIRKPDIR